MTDPVDRSAPLASTVDCGVCGTPLIYGSEPVGAACALCGREGETLIVCPRGHYVCDECHGKGSLEVVRALLAASDETDALAISERLMEIPSLPMHGPEHHAIVPGALVAAARNAGYPVADDAIDKAVQRGSKVPGGWCGYCGACGAAIGVGIAASVLTAATPVKGPQRTQALGATRAALGGMLDDAPRCCKRATRVAIIEAVEYLRTELGIDLPESAATRACDHVARNAQCPGEECPFFAGSAAG